MIKTLLYLDIMNNREKDHKRYFNILYVDLLGCRIIQVVYSGLKAGLNH